MNDTPSLAQRQLAAVTESYFQRQIAAPDAARSRAERSYTIVGAVGATLLGAGVISGIGGHSALVTALGLLALSLWALAAAVFVYAVGLPVKPMKSEGRYVGEDEFVQAARDLADQETKTIRKRHLWASVLAGVAAAVTLGALVAAAVGSEGEELRTFVLSPEGARIVAHACGRPSQTHVTGRLTSPLDADYITFKPSDARCPQVGIARRDVIAVLG